MSFHFGLDGGSTVTLPTAGKYCDRDIVVTATDNGCTEKHFTCNLMGSGTGSLSFHVPFAPDFIQLIGLDPTFTNQKPYVAAAFTADLRAFGQIAGICIYANASGAAYSAMCSTTSVHARYSRTDDGVVTIKDLSSAWPIVFDPAYTYTVIAVKYTEQTDAERITAFINGLTGSGSVTLNQAKVTAAFADNTWAALIATKPNWTFTWI